MAKVAIKSDKITPFGGIFFILDLFDRLLSGTVDSTLPERAKLHGYKYSEILRSLMSVFLCGGSCVEDLSSHLMEHLSLHPRLRTASSDTILRAIAELSTDNITYTSESGKQYGFNPSELLNRLMVRAAIAMGALAPGRDYVLDFDHQVIATEKYDALPTYKHCTGYFPGVATIGNLIVGIENRDGNANVRFMQEHTLKRLVAILAGEGIKIDKMRMDCGSCSEDIVKTVKTLCRLFYIRAGNCQSQNMRFDILRGWKTCDINGKEFEVCSVIEQKCGTACRLVVQRQKREDGNLDLWDGQYIYRCIMTNDLKSGDLDIVKFYNARGAQERIFDEMNNGFGWKRLPKSFMNENAVYLILTAIIHNFYKTIMANVQGLSEFGLRPQSRVKAFVFKYISVAAKWTRTSRQNVLNIYSSKRGYRTLFCNYP